MRSGLLILAFLLIALGGWSWWTSKHQEEAPATSPADGPGQTIDYYVKDFSVTTMTPEGKPARRLQAELMQHFLADDTTQLQQPFLQVFNPDAPFWEVRASTGWISGDGELVLLSGDVDIKRRGDEQNRPIRVVTSNLRVQPNQDYAETDEPVTITSELSKVTSVGMQAWLRDPVRLKLLSNTRAHYVQ